MCMLIYLLILQLGTHYSYHIFLAPKSDSENLYQQPKRNPFIILMINTFMCIVVISNVNELCNISVLPREFRYYIGVTSVRQTMVMKFVQFTTEEIQTIPP